MMASRFIQASLVAQLVKNPPSVQETWLRFLGWEDSLEKGKATYSCILTWRIPWIIHGVTKSWTRLGDFHFTSLDLFNHLAEIIWEIANIYWSPGLNLSPFLIRSDVGTIMTSSLPMRTLKYRELKYPRDFPGGMVAKTPRSQCRGPGFDPWSEN